MSSPRRQLPQLNEQAVRLLAEDAKLALLATVTDGNLPHVTLITSIQAKSPAQLMFGQFCEGLSKTNVAKNPLVGFLALDRECRWLRGKARWSGSAKQGEDYQAFNRKPMFRYNAYFGIHTVHYLDVVEVEEERRLATAPLVAGAVLARLASLTVAAAREEGALNAWSRALLRHPATLKFLAYVGDDGHPVIAPAIAAATRGTGRVVLLPTRATGEKPPIRAGSHVALFAIDLEMRSVLLRGVFHGWRGTTGLGAATMDVDWVYNTMPPKHGQIFPPSPLVALRFAAPGQGRERRPLFDVSASASWAGGSSE